MTTYLKRAIGSAGTSLIIGIFAAFVSYLTRLVLARKLDPAGYGLFYSVLTFVLFFLFFRDLGLPEALVKYISHYRSKADYNSIKTAITSVFILEMVGSLILAILFIGVSGYLSEHYFKYPISKNILFILILYIFFSALFRIIKVFFQGYQKIFLFSSVEFAKNLLILLCILLFLYLGFDILAPAIAYSLAAIMLFVIYLVPAIKLFNPFKYKIINLKDRTKEILLFGIPSFATAVGGRIIGYADTLILTYFVSLTEVGIYNAVLPSALILFFIGRSVGSIAFPMSSELWSKGDKKRLSEGLKLIHRYAFIIIVPMIGVPFVFSKFLITIFFGLEYSSGYIAFRIILIGVLFYVVAMMNNNIILGIGKPKTVTKIIFMAVFSNVTLNILLIPRYGIEGAAFATTFSYLIVLVTSTYKVSRYVGNKFPLKEWIKIVVPGMSLFVFVHLMEGLIVMNQWFEIFISGTFATVMYLILCYLFGAIDISEIRKYTRRLTKDFNFL